MGGKRRSSGKSFFSILAKLFQRPHHIHDAKEAEQPRGRGATGRTSDEDRFHWVGEPDIDRKATEFIAKFHETRLSDLKTETVYSTAL